MVYYLVYPDSMAWGASAMPPYRGIVYVPDLRLGFANRQLDGFVIAGGSELLSIHERSLVKLLTRQREIDVGNVDCVSQSKKIP